jgi:hypothetical protein
LSGIFDLGQNSPANGQNGEQLSFDVGFNWGRFYGCLIGLSPARVPT